MPSKTHERYFKPISRNGFSSGGTNRSQGRVGQTSDSRSLVRTPFRGTEAMGNGGCCGTYKSNIINSCWASTPSNGISSMTSNGLILSRIKNPTSVYNSLGECGCIKDTYKDTSPLNKSAGVYTKRKGELILTI